MSTTKLNSGTQPVQLTQAEYDQLKQFMEYMEAEREALKGGNPKQIIEFYLDHKQSKDQEFQKVYPKNPDGKTIDDCYNYVLNKARTSQGGGSSAMLQHTIVFGWAEEYFRNPEIKKPASAPKAKVSTGSTYQPKKLSPAETKKKAAEWEKQHAADIAAWDTTNKPMRDKWEREHQKKVDKWTHDNRIKIMEWDSDMFKDPAENPYRNEVCPFLSETNPYAADKNPYLKNTNPYKVEETKDEEKPATEPTPTAEVETPAAEPVQQPDTTPAPEPEPDYGHYHESAEYPHEEDYPDDMDEQENIEYYNQQAEAADDMEF